MRRTLIGLVAAGLLFAGCSDSDDDGGGGGDEASGGDSDSFCSDFQALEDQFAEDPEAGAVQDTIREALEELDPPDEIADDFEQVLEVFRQTADVDLEDPEAQADAQELAEGAAEAQERVSTYLEDECGIEPGGSGGEGEGSTEE